MFDFYKTFSTYSNTELLKIVAQPGNYQSDAVEAARQLLDERNISEKERDEATRELSIAVEHDNKPDRVQKAITTIGNAIAYLFTPSPVFDVRKWNYWLCIAFLVLHANWLINSFKFFWTIVGYRDFMNSMTFMTLFSVLYFSGMIILLLLTHRVGWLMLIAFSSYEIVARIYMFFAIRYLPNRLVYAIIIILLYVLLIRLLAKPRVVIYFRGNYRLYKMAIVAGVIFAIAFWIWLFFQL